MLGMCKLLLSGIGYVPTPNVHSDVWDCVGSYAIHMLLACRLKITFTLSLKLIISFLVYTTPSFITFSNSHFFSDRSWHASSSIVLYLWLGAERPTTQSFNSWYGLPVLLRVTLASTWGKICLQEPPTRN